MNFYNELSKILSCEESAVDAKTWLEEMIEDSLDLMDMIIALESIYEIDQGFLEENIDSVVTFGDLRNLLGDAVET